MTAKSIGQVANYRSITRCGVEELAIQQRLNAPSGGVMFARKRNSEEKRAARDAVVSIFAKHDGPLHVLTMPGMKWKFEGLLLGARDEKFREAPAPERTRIACIENDRSIYHAAMLTMPGCANKHNLIRVLPNTPFAERVLSSLFIDRYYFGNVDDLMAETGQQFDGAWLDYTGPVSIDRLKKIGRFFARGIASTLVLTTLRARWNRETANAVEKEGLRNLILRYVPGAVVHEMEYVNDGAPMHQIAIRK